MKTNQDYKNAALAALKGNWTQAVLVTLVFLTINIIGVYFVPIALFVSLPLTVGLYTSFRLLYVEGHANLTENAFKIGFGNYGRHLGGMLLMTLYVLGWSLLLIVPGVIKSFSYALTPFILAEKPELSADEAIELSMKMMDGHKLDLFVLYLSFIGWYLLSIFTLYIGMLWVMPYQYTTVAAFYEDVKAEYESKSVVA